LWYNIKMIGTLCRYPHPHDSTKFIYVGQGPKRDKDHRNGRTSFGRRFKKIFPNEELPKPIMEQIEVDDQIGLNGEETIWMFRFHTWRGYGNGMNITLPGLQDYRAFSRLAQLCWDKEARFQVQRKGGLTSGRNAVKSGQMERMRNLPQSIEARRRNAIILGQKNRESGWAESLGKEWGRKAVESGQLREASNSPQAKVAQRINGERIGKTYGHENGLKNGRKAAEVGQISALGKEQGQKHIESGHIQALGRAQGRKNAESGRLLANGIKAVESGQIQNLGRSMKEKKLGIFSPDYDRSKVGKINAHKQFHVNRGTLNPNCLFCCEEKD
jgi:hypothetical protein